jgi:multiple antibiotic resistance protein
VRVLRLVVQDAEIVQRSFFPITFPLTTGPGTIAASIALGARIPRDPVKYALGMLVADCGAAIVSLTLYLIFRNPVAVPARLGKISIVSASNRRVLRRASAVQ